MKTLPAKLLSGILTVSTVVAVGSYAVAWFVEKAFHRLVESAMEEAIVIVLWLFELVLSRLDPFITDTVIL